MIPQRFRGSTCEISNATTLTIQSTQGNKIFTFDKVFDQNVNQQGVWEDISDSIESFIQGYNVSVMAYGQSGAGKSYTMGTTKENQEDDNIRGIIPRAAISIFSQLNTSTSPSSSLSSSSSSSTKSGMRQPQRYSMNISDNKEKNWKLKATYIEIYNEQLRDLLIPENIPLSNRPQVIIREDPKGRILLTGLTQIEINTVQDLLDALDFGSKIRQTDSTTINAQSSRSHAVFSLNLVQTRTLPIDKRRSVPADSKLSSENTMTIDSKLHFVDLAGSERLKNTGAQGDRVKEGISINAGLASLGKVISQLSSKTPSTHISYRDSRLTRLLQDSLGGNAYTYMIACINPAEFHLSETLNTVQYAQRARSIQIKPEIQQHFSEANKSAQIEKLKAEVAFLRQQMTVDRSSIFPETSDEAKRVAELQNQLLDMQENFTSLNKRHESLILDIGNNSAYRNEHESSDDRLKRSSSFAEAVEKVVLEYEKTIQSLESSLTNTRSTLSNTESSLMEKESRVAFLEGTTDKAQQKIEKLIQQEAQTENYLLQLQNQMENVATNEESASTLIQSLRAELVRAKDNQSSTEGYISALEGRLVEAEQDQNVLKRELGKLEQVVERQRNLGFFEEKTIITNGHSSDDENNDMQITFMSDKVDTLTQELIDVREEREATASELAELQRKYTIALQSLVAQSSEESPTTITSTTRESSTGSMNDSSTTNVNDRSIINLNDPSTPPPRRSDSFLVESLPTISTTTTRPNNKLRRGESSRSLPSDCSSPRQSSIFSTPGPHMTTSVVSSALDTSFTTEDNDEMKLQHDQLLKVHREALQEIDNLKTELNRQQLSPIKSSPLARRKPSQDLIGSITMSANVDRVNRSFASLRNVGLDLFESKPDIRQQFDLHLNAIMTELLTKTERAQQVEVESFALRKQLDEKTTIISGLTRERSINKVSPNVDFSAVTHMRDQLLSSQQQIQDLEQSHHDEIHQLQSELTLLKDEIQQHSTRKSQNDNDDNQNMTIDKLQQDIQDHLSSHQEQSENINNLRDAYEEALGDLSKSSIERELLQQDLKRHQDLVADLQEQMNSQHEVIRHHEDGIQMLKDIHAAELENRQEENSSADLLNNMSKILGQPVDHDNYATYFQSFVKSKRDLELDHQQILNHHSDLKDQLKNGQIETDELKSHLKSEQTEKDELNIKIEELEESFDKMVAEHEAIVQKEAKSSRLVQELEDQLNSNFDHSQAQTKRLSNMQNEQNTQLQEALRSKIDLEKLLEEARLRITGLENRPGSVADNRQASSIILGPVRDSSAGMIHELMGTDVPPNRVQPKAIDTSNLGGRRTPSIDHSTPLSPPPTLPLPAIPGSSSNPGTPLQPRSFSPFAPASSSSAPNPLQVNRPITPLTTSNLPTPPVSPPQRDPVLIKQLEDQETRLRSIEKHLAAEKQLTATLEEALVDLENAQTRSRQELDNWKKKASVLTDEVGELKRQDGQSRASLQQFEEEREMRMKAEKARVVLEERMRGLEAERKKKKKGTFNCF